MDRTVERRARILAGMGAAAIGGLLVSRDAQAQGLTGGLAGLREAYFLFWGLVGVVPAVSLAVAFSRFKKQGATGLTYFLTLPAVLYVPTAIALVFFPSSDLASKFPGVVGFGLLFALAAFYIPGMAWLRRSVQGVLAIILVVLIWIPNEYWEVPFLSFEHVEFVDNVAPREMIETLRSRSAPKAWVALVDGRHLVQDAEGKRRDSRGRPVFPYGDGVVVEATSNSERGRWYDVAFFNKTYRYAMSAVSKRARYVIPLSTRSEHMYQPSGTSLAILLDDTAGVDYDDMLAEALQSANGWSTEPDPGDIANAGHWLTVLAALANLDLHSPKLLSKVFRQKDNRYRLQFLIDTGVSPNAVDARGNSMLHVAAREGDLHSVSWLLERGADARMTNDNGQTPLDVAKARYRTAPRTAPIEKIEELLEPSR